jgi:RNA polymerase sigma-70 factor (ECF subfamily)
MEQPSNLDDGTLLEAVLASDAAAWRELVRRYRGLIYRCITKVLSRYESVLSSEDVNEVFSDVCYNLLRDNMRKLRSYDPNRGSKLGSWIGLISINTAYDRLRVIARQPLLDRIDGVLEIEDIAPTALVLLLERERWVSLLDLAGAFSPRDRRFMELYFGCGMAPTEVARLMKISVKTVYSKKNKIRSRLAALARSGQPAAMAA